MKKTNKRKKKSEKKKHFRFLHPDMFRWKNPVKRDQRNSISNTYRSGDWG